jgi:hypothetical protein
MPLPSPPPLLDRTLRAAARRYRLPRIGHAPAGALQTAPATALAMAIEQAREAAARGVAPDPAVKRLFTEALAHMIRAAVREKSGDPVFQAMVLRHRLVQVREYASLSAHARRDGRLVRAAVNAIAHPGKRRRIPPGPRQEFLTDLHSHASSGSWPALDQTAQRLLAMPQTSGDAPFQLALMRLLDSPALKNLLRLEVLAADEDVRRYRLLQDRAGPGPGSAAAAAHGIASQERGAAVEAAAARALDLLAQRLNESESEQAPYRVVTSMRVPASIRGDRDRAKSEWDAVLLRRCDTAGEATVWQLCLLVEAKASVDAATTDLPRLLRGLRLLGHANAKAVYPFETRQGLVQLHGASLAALATDQAGVARSVLYCCDAPAEAPPRLLGAASRMQLLSAQASVEFASALLDKRHADAQSLEPVWHQLLESPRWRAVLHQYQTLRRVRELMVHIDDLLRAIAAT